MTAVACPTSSTCFAVGQSGTFLASVDGGTTWKSRSVSDEDFTGITCPTSSMCLMTAMDGTVLTSADAGTTWSQHTVDAQALLNAITCARSTHCLVAGNAGALYMGNGSAVASITTTQYASTADHYAFNCPSTWQGTSTQTADTGDKILVGIAPAMAGCTSPDQQAGFILLAARRSTDNGTLKTNAFALVRHSGAPIGAPRYGTAAIQGIPSLRVTASLQDAHHHVFQATVLALSTTAHTYYIFTILPSGPAASSQDTAALAAVLTSLTLH